ncbi:unnamed protein product [Heterobilharzia americana]|nr:unnamed protein product [Heterobilharzia americana]
MTGVLKIPSKYLREKIASLNPKFSIKSSILKIFNKPKATGSLESIRIPPEVAQFTLKNAYIPLSRRTLVRELLQDNSVVLQSERKSLEKLAVFLDKKLESQFQILQSEFSLLSQPVDTISYAEKNSLSSLNDKGNNSNELDREFWFLRRLSNIAPVAGFIEVSQDQLQHACTSIKSKNHGLVAFVDPDDYDVLRFWIRGFHPNFNAGAACSTIFTSKQSTSSDNESVSTFSKLSVRVSHLVGILIKSIKRSYSPNIYGYESVDSVIGKSDGFYFGRVLMCVRRKNSDNLDLKLFENVPVTGVVRNSNFADNLLYLLPNLRTVPLSQSARFVILMSTATAAGCLGVITPIAWLFDSNYDLVLAWSIAASASAASILCLVWARYWRAQTNLANNLRYMQYLCCQASGLLSINILLKLAKEQEFKAALLTYALLLRPTESNTSLSPMQLGLRAESWIAKRLSPQLHVSLPSSIGAPIENHPPDSRFSGGSGPLFDLSFDAERSLIILRRLDLVRGSESSPSAVHPATASLEVPNDTSSSVGLDRLG